MEVKSSLGATLQADVPPAAEGDQSPLRAAWFATGSQSTDIAAFIKSGFTTAQGVIFDVGPSTVSVAMKASPLGSLPRDSYYVTRCLQAPVWSNVWSSVDETPDHIASCHAEKVEAGAKLKSEISSFHCEWPGCFVAPGGRGDYLIYLGADKPRVEQNFYAWWNSDKPRDGQQPAYLELNRYGIFGTQTITPGSPNFLSGDLQYLSMSEEGALSKDSKRKYRTVGIMGEDAATSNRGFVHTAPVRMSGLSYIHVYRSVTLPGWEPFLLGIPVALSNLAAIDNPKHQGSNPAAVQGKATEAAIRATHAYFVSGNAPFLPVPSTLFQHVTCNDRAANGNDVTWTCRAEAKWHRYPEATVDLGVGGRTKRAVAPSSSKRANRTQTVVVLQLPSEKKKNISKFTVTCVGVATTGAKDVDKCDAAYY